MLVQGSISVPPKRVVFLTKFCFDVNPSGGASGQWDITLVGAKPNTGEMELVLFDDQAESYPDESAISQLGSECGGERLQTSARFARHIYGNKTGHFTMPLEEKIRPRWWYVAVLDCSGDEHVLEYRIHMTNPRQGWLQEFSMDQSSLVTLGVFLMVYASLAAAQARAVTTRSCSARVRHPLRLMLLVSIFAAFLGMLACLLDGLWFMRTGLSLRALSIAGATLGQVSKFSLTSILLLLSTGRCISQALRTQDLWRITILVTPLFLACLSLEIWGKYSASRKYTTGSVFSSWCGALIVFTDLGMLVLYLRSLRRSYSVEMDTDKQDFYNFWGLLYACAFLCLPASVLASLALSPWVRAEVVLVATNCLHFLILASLIKGLWPERTQRFFCIDNDDLVNSDGAKSDLLSPDDGSASPALLETHGHQARDLELH